MGFDGAQGSRGLSLLQENDGEGVARRELPTELLSPLSHTDTGSSKKHPTLWKKSDPGVLDVEDEEQRQTRIGSLLERLNVTSASASAQTPPSALLNVTDHKHTRGPIEPPNELLARVQAFLPAIQASNAALAGENPEDVDIENLREDEEQYIEMNLGLGVFESKRPQTGSGSESTSSGSESESESESGSGTDDVDSSSDSESGSEDDADVSSTDDNSESDPDSDSGSSVDMSPVIPRPIKPLPRRVSHQARIEVLSSSPAPATDPDVT
ncbi:hypothetical protein BU15DRAFT_75064 [Melanogaster broomeanus]|nr:hypothetical protein BU15DRAFT_75064 [Melanogaster broomeanus]